MTKNINPCPFCNIPPVVSFNQTTMRYKISCGACQTNNITLYVEDDNLDDCALKWNTLAIKKHEKKIAINSIQQTLYGFLIFPDGELIKNEIFGHGEYLIKRFNITVVNFDHGKYCAENKIVRISTFENNIAIDLPHEYNKIQILTIFKVFDNNPILCNLTKFSLFFTKTKKYLVFYKLNELLEELDHVL